MGIIEIHNVNKQFGSVNAVCDANFVIEHNEFFALLGPSGCGKTTLLRMIAGFSQPTSGRIVIDGEDMMNVPPNRRPVNMVFQSYAVFPHMSVAHNVGYGLRMENTDKATINTSVAAALELVGLAGFDKRMPGQLSGGQRQRVALARALVKRPKVLLLDEPLSALDAKLREQMQSELASLQADIGVSFVIVTHDQDEALSMADRIAVMNEGKTEQIASPELLYEKPANPFVADFIGRVNLFAGQVIGATASRVSIQTKALGRVELGSDQPMEGDVVIAVRPEKISIRPASRSNATSRIHGTINRWAYYGDTSHITVLCDDGHEIGVIVQNKSADSRADLTLGDAVGLDWNDDSMLVLGA